MQDFIPQCLRTEASPPTTLTSRQGRLLHAVIGLAGETGELADAVKRNVFYGAELDVVNVREEIGDCLWYLAIAMDEMGETFDTEQALVIAKLRQRFPSKFDLDATLNRDLEAERHILEG